MLGTLSRFLKDLALFVWDIWTQDRRSRAAYFCVLICWILNGFTGKGFLYGIGVAFLYIAVDCLGEVTEGLSIRQKNSED